MFVLCEKIENKFVYESSETLPNIREKMLPKKLVGARINNFLTINHENFLGNLI